MAKENQSWRNILVILALFLFGLLSFFLAIGTVLYVREKKEEPQRLEKMRIGDCTYDVYDNAIRHSDDCDCKIDWSKECEL